MIILLQLVLRNHISHSKYNNNYSPRMIRFLSNGLVDLTYQVQNGFSVGGIYDNVVNEIYKYPYTTIQR